MNPYYKHLETLIDNRAGTSHGSQTNNGSSCLQMFFKIGAIINFANFSSLFSIKLQAPTLLKRDPNTAAFLWNLRNF